jgi:hypothetical protein
METTSTLPICAHQKELCIALKELHDSLCSRLKGWEPSDTACAEIAFNQAVYRVLGKCVNVSPRQSDEALNLEALFQERQHAEEERDLAALELRRIVTDTECCAAQLRDHTAHMVSAVLSVSRTAKKSGDSRRARAGSFVQEQDGKSWQMVSSNLAQRIDDLQSACSKLASSSCSAF